MSNSQLARSIRLASLVGFPLLVAAFSLLYATNEPLYIDLLKEDRIIEWLTFSLLLFAGFLAFDIGVQIRRYERIFHWFFFAFALFCVVAAFEEISWGERVFDIEPPEFFFEESDQQEISFHNVFQQQVPIKTKTLVGLGLFLYGVLLPLLALNRRIRSLLYKFRVLVPPLFLLPAFLLAALLMADIPSGWEEEAGEFVFSLAFVVLMLWTYIEREPVWREIEAQRSEATNPWLADQPLSLAAERALVAFCTLGAFCLRVWHLDRLGLGIGEAESALIAQATLPKILASYWTGLIEHPPLWALLFHSWVTVTGASEAALRLLPALLGVLTVPLFWQLMRVVRVQDWRIRLLATLLVATSPVLVLYSQDASLFMAVILAALVSIYAAVRMANRPSLGRITLFVLANWLLVGLHTFAVLLLVGEGVVLLAFGWTRRQAGQPANGLRFTAAFLLALAPGLLWLWLAPGVGATFGALDGYVRALANAWATDFLLFMTLPFSLVIAATLIRAGRGARRLGIAGLVLAALISTAGLVYYYGFYQKSQYREMITYVEQNATAEDGYLLLTPKQHPLARYYLGSERSLLPVPESELPDHWPARPLPIVPEEVDGQIQAHLSNHPVLWLLIHEASDEDEADRTDFTRQYLKAVAHRGECLEWESREEAELCRFFSPAFAPKQTTMDVGALYEDELLLESANLALTDPLPDGRRALLATLHWEAVNKPERDFKVSLRLLNDLGENAGQHDDFPIGSLIVPTLWNQGDEKPGYMAILLVPDMPPGEYTLDLLVYKPHNFETIEAQRDGQGLDQSIELARVHVDSDQSVEISSNAR